jgi:hypothetical protein
MSMYVYTAIGAGALIALAGSTPAAHAGSYAYTAVPAPSYVVNAAFYYVAGINDSGEFVAGGSDVNFDPVAFAWNNGTYTQITYNGSGGGVGVSAVNNEGVAAAGVAGHAFTFNIQTGVATKVKKLRTGADAASINSAGELAGSAPFKGKSQVFYTQGKKHVPAFYAVPGADATAVSIDDSNTVYGYYRVLHSVTYHGLIISAGVATEVDVPGASSTFLVDGRNGTAYGGYVVNNTGPEIGFTLTNGTYTTYQCPSGGSAVFATVAFGAVAGGGIAAQCYYQSNPNQINAYVVFGNQFYPILPPGAVTATLTAISPDGTQLAGTYSDGTTTYFYTAACTPDQIPCTQ